MSDCIFCKIIAGEIPSFKVYEDETFIAILDRFPSSKGHVLIIPKRHAENLQALTESEAAAILPLAQKLSAKITKALSPDGINIMQNNGKAAGQEIFHYHLHIVPRYDGDGIRFGLPRTEPSLDELAAIGDILCN